MKVSHHIGRPEPDHSTISGGSVSSTGQTSPAGTPAPRAPKSGSDSQPGARYLQIHCTAAEWAVWSGNKIDTSASVTGSIFSRNGCRGLNRRANLNGLAFLLRPDGLDVVLGPSQQVLDDAHLVNDDCVVRQTDALDGCDPFPHSGSNSDHGLTRGEFSTRRCHGIDLRFLSPHVNVDICPAELRKKRVGGRHSAY